MQILHMGGAGLWIGLFLGVVGFAATVGFVAVGLFRKGWILPLFGAFSLGSLAMMTALIGFSFHSSKMSVTERVVDRAPPEYAGMIRSEGSTEAAIPLFTGLFAATPPALGAIALLFLATRRKAQPIPLSD